MVDILEEEGAIVIKAESPEVDEKDVEISIQGDTLTIRGERKLEREDKKDNYHRIERSYGSFSRSFTLPENVNRDKISAESKDGVLRVTLPKRQPEKSKSVTIPVD